MENISTPVIILFIATTLFTCYQFYQASNKSMKVLGIITSWMLLITLASLNGFYKNFNATPPTFMLLPAPPLLFCLIFPFTGRGKKFIDSLHISNLTLLHVSRIPVEITLYFMASAKLIPRLMTFEGYNFDILSGILGGMLYVLLFSKKRIHIKWLLVWNIVGLLLLINIVTLAILSIPASFQQLAFDQPNVGIALFPFVWLPGIIVPIVFFSHIAAIIKLSGGIFNFDRPKNVVHS